MKAKDLTLKEQSEFERIFKDVDTPWDEREIKLTEFASSKQGRIVTFRVARRWISELDLIPKEMLPTRLSVLPDGRGLILGIDRKGLLDPGYVYELEEFDGEIIFRKKGKYSLNAKGGYCSENSDANSIIESGLHLITKD